MSFSCEALVSGEKINPGGHARLLFPFLPRVPSSLGWLSLSARLILLISVLTRRRVAPRDLLLVRFAYLLFGHERLSSP